MVLTFLIKAYIHRTQTRKMIWTSSLELPKRMLAYLKPALIHRHQLKNIVKMCNTQPWWQHAVKGSSKGSYENTTTRAEISSNRDASHLIKPVPKTTVSLLGQTKTIFNSKNFENFVPSAPNHWKMGEVWPCCSNSKHIREMNIKSLWVAFRNRRISSHRNLHWK